MGIGVGFIIENPCMVYSVNSDLAKGMYNIIVLHNNPNVVYNTLIIIEKG